MATRNFVPRNHEEGNIGTSLKNWLKGFFKDLFVSGSITNGTDSLTVSDIKNTVNATHVQNTDTKLDNGGANEVSALQIKSHINDLTNPHETIASQISTDVSGQNVQTTLDAKTTDLNNHLADLNNPHEVRTNQVQFPAINTTTSTGHVFSEIWSAGWIEGGEITDAGSGNINIAAGEGLIRALDDIESNLTYIFWFGITNQAIPSGATRYIYVEYNTGNPQVVLSTTERTDLNTNIYLGEVHNLGGVLRIHNDYRTVADVPNRLFHWIEDLIGTKSTSGDIVSDPSSPSRKISVTSGLFWDRHIIEYISPAFDSNVSDTFANYHRDSFGDWTRVFGQTEWENTKYDDGSGTLANMTVGYYSNRWVIRGFSGDIAVLYDQAEYLLQSDAEKASPPIKPEEYVEHGFYIAQIIFQKSDISPIEILDIRPTFGFTPIGSPSSIHNNLAGLQGGTGGEYFHLSNSQLTALLAHLTNISNPHSVTKTQVGLGSVLNDLQLKDADKDIDGTLSANSDTKIASQKATKTYADTKGDMFKSVYDTNADGIVEKAFLPDKQYAAADTETSTTSTTPINKLTLTWTPPAAGTYQIEWYFELANSGGGGDSWYRVQLNATDISLARISCTVSWANSGYNHITGFKQVALLAASNTITIDFYAQAGTAYIKNARIRAYRVA